ncbi:MAG TPA: S9 family peptidase, partial [Acidobacteriaceae bacterium]
MTFAMRTSTRNAAATAAICLLSLTSYAQGTLADYQRAHDLRAKSRDLVVNTPGAATWIGDSDHFWYPKTVKGGTDFVLVDAEVGAKKPAFDQDRLAAAISSATGHPYTGLKLPFAPVQGRPGARPAPDAIATTAPLTFLDGERSIQFGVDGSLYKCSLSDYTCIKGGPIPRGGRPDRNAAPEDPSLSNPEASLEGLGGDPVDGLEYQPPAPQDGDQGRYRGRPRACAPSPPSQQSQQSLPYPPRAARAGGAGQPPSVPAEVCASFDGNYEAFVQNFNVFLKPKGDQPAYPISFDGSEDNRYSLRTLA